MNDQTNDIAILQRQLEQAQAQITQLQLAVNRLDNGSVRPYADAHSQQVMLHMELGVWYVCGCAVEGDIAEFGTMSGRTAGMLAEAMTRYDKFYQGPRKRLHLFDSFQGLPEADSPVDKMAPHVRSGAWAAGTCLGVSEADLIDLCSSRIARERIRTYPGWFADTLPTVAPGTKFGLLHIDCDLYQSARDVLQFCFSQEVVADGAALFFDDWNCNAAHPDLGERRAWREAVRQYAIDFTDCGEYGMGSRKFIVHSYRRTSRLAKADC